MGMTAKEYAQRWRHSDPLRYLLQYAKKRAKQQELEFSVSKEDFAADLPTHCPVLGCELTYSSSVQAFNSASLDRVDPCKGYVPGNVVIVCWRVNKLKGDASLDELSKIVAYMRGHLTTSGA